MMQFYFNMSELATKVAVEACLYVPTDVACFST